VEIFLLRFQSLWCLSEVTGQA